MKRYWDIEKMLKGSGWRRSRDAEARMRKALDREYKDQIYKKRLSGEWVDLTLPVDPWASAVYLSVRPPRSWSFEKGKEHRAETFRVVNFEDIDSVADIDAVAQEMAAWRKKHKDPRRQRDIEAFQWRGRSGPEAREAWQADVRDTVLRHMKRQQQASESRERYLREHWSETTKRIQPWLSQRHLTQLVLTGLEMLPEGVTRIQARRDIGKILGEMEKEGILERMPPGTVSRETEWILDEKWAAENVPKLKKLKSRLMR